MNADNKSRIRTLYEAADQGDLDAILDLFGPNYVDHRPSEVRGQERPTRGCLRAFYEELIGAFPDTRHQIHELIAEGDLVAVRVSAVGTHLGEFHGCPASGRSLANDALVIYRLQDGKISERWGLDRSSILDQIRDEQTSPESSPEASRG